MCLVKLRLLTVLSSVLGSLGIWVEVIGSSQSNDIDYLMYHKQNIKRTCWLMMLVLEVGWGSLESAIWYTFYNFYPLKNPVSSRNINILLMQGSRFFANLIVMGGGILARAFVQAYRQAIESKPFYIYVIE